MSGIAERLQQIGIRTGMVVVGDIGSGTSQEQLALGSTLDVATRLQSIAPVNALIQRAAANSFQSRL